MTGTIGTLRKSSLYQIPDSSLLFNVLLLIMGIYFVPLIIPTATSLTTNVTVSHPTHHRHNSRIPHSGVIVSSNHTSMNMNVTAIGQQCDEDTQCANSSVCQVKVFENNLVLKVCQCDPLHMNKIKESCFVKPGHQCYFPEHEHKLLNCMPEAECRSGLNRTRPEAARSGYCFCKDRRDDEPYRPFNVETEISRCGAQAIEPGVVFLFGVFVALV